MVKVEKDDNSVCNSCMSKNPYKILATPNEHNGAVIYLCEDCLHKALGQIYIDRVNTITVIKMEDIHYGKALDGVIKRIDGRKL